MCHLVYVKSVINITWIYEWYFILNQEGYKETEYNRVCWMNRYIERERVTERERDYRDRQRER